MRAGIISASPILAVAITVSMFAVSCGRGSGDISNPDPSPTTTSEMPSIPDLSPATRIEIQASALSAACLSVSCDTKPVYAHLHAGPDLRAALEDAFGTDVEFLSYQELQDATGRYGTYAHGATLFDVMRTHSPADDVAGVDVWVEEGFGIGESNHVPLQVERHTVGAGHARRHWRYRYDRHVVAAAPCYPSPVARGLERLRTWVVATISGRPDVSRQPAPQLPVGVFPCVGDAPGFGV